MLERQGPPLPALDTELGHHEPCLGLHQPDASLRTGAGVEFETGGLGHDHAECVEVALDPLARQLGGLVAVDPVKRTCT